MFDVYIYFIAWATQLECLHVLGHQKLNITEMLSIGCSDFVWAYIYHRYAEHNSETGWRDGESLTDYDSVLCIVIVIQQCPLSTVSSKPSSLSNHSLIPGWHQTFINKPFYISFCRVSYVQQRVNYRMKSEPTASYILGLKQPKTTTTTNETHVLWRSEKFMQVCHNWQLPLIKRYNFSC